MRILLTTLFLTLFILSTNFAEARDFESTLSSQTGVTAHHGGHGGHGPYGGCGH